MIKCDELDLERHPFPSELGKDAMKFASFALILLFLTACGGQAPGIDLTAGNSGQTVSASMDQFINVKLDSNATTGYKWNLVTEPTPRILKFISSQYNPPVGSQLGAGGSETWQWQVVGTGTTTLKLAYYRPSSPDQVAKEFTVTIQVQ